MPLIVVGIRGVEAGGPQVPRKQPEEDADRIRDVDRAIGVRVPAPEKQRRRGLSSYALRIRCASSVKPVRDSLIRDGFTWAPRTAASQETLGDHRARAPTYILQGE